VSDNVKILERIKSKEGFEYLDNIILPENLFKNLKVDKRTYNNLGEYIKENYKVDEESPFKLAIEDNQGGISHLLLSK
jgi:hypothetical protein